MRVHEAGVRSLFLHPDGKLAATTSDDQITKIWSVETGEVESQYTGHEYVNIEYITSDCAFSNNVYCAYFNDDIVITSAYDYKIHLYHRGVEKPYHIFSGTPLFHVISNS